MAFCSAMLRLSLIDLQACIRLSMHRRACMSRVCKCKYFTQPDGHCRCSAALCVHTQRLEDVTHASMPLWCLQL